MQVIGITGISGTGKSTVSEKIANKTSGTYINADSIVKALRKKRRRILRKNYRRTWKRYIKWRFRNRHKEAFKYYILW